MWLFWPLCLQNLEGECLEIDTDMSLPSQVTGWGKMAPEDLASENVVGVVEDDMESVFQ